MQVVLFEDEKVRNLFPIALTRAGFEVSCGGTNLYDLVEKVFRGEKISFIARDYLQKERG